MRITLDIFFLSIVIILGVGCTKEIFLAGESLVRDSEYDSAFPNTNSSTNIEQITRSVQAISCMAYFNNYFYRVDDQVTLTDVETKGYEDLAWKTEFTNTNVRGTGTVIYHNDRKIALLTSAHVVDFPDTVVIYYENEYGRTTNFIKTALIKSRQVNYVANLPGIEGGSLEILAYDKAEDTAIIGGRIAGDWSDIINIFNYPLGNARELHWGDFVFVIGYPKGKKMVTTGIVSQPNADNSASFIIDAPFNIGMSGGIVLALRDGIPNFELVGITNSVSADFENFITPPDTFQLTPMSEEIPYNGETFVRKKGFINYGITNVVSAESIRKLIQENNERLIEKGYNFRSFIH